LPLRHENKKGQEIKLEADFKQCQVFTEQQEKELCEYLIRSTQKGFGLSSVDCRKLAFELGSKNDIKIPRQWKENEKAGTDWFVSFRKRNPDITLQKLENCSLTRTTSFNPHNIKIFYDNLQKVYDREPKFFDTSNVFNVDETATTVPIKTSNVIDTKNTKQVSQATRGGKGILVTTCCIINAAGGFLPPAMVFPCQICFQNAQERYTKYAWPSQSDRMDECRAFHKNVGAFHKIFELINDKSKVTDFG